MIMIQRLFVLTFFLLLVAGSASAQLRFRVAGGLSTSWITNDNPATYRITGTGDGTDTTAGFGGGLDGMQMGWGIKGFADLDKQKMFRIPFGIDLWQMSGAQSLTGTNTKVLVRHDVDVYSGSVGFEWSFVEFPLAYARAYIGVEARVTHVAPNSIYFFTQTINSQGEILSQDTTFNGKEAATRMGAMARIGIEGEIYYPVFLNTSVGWGAMNLIGRDMRPTTAENPEDRGRGELLTPTPLNEAYESVVMNLNFTFMIQVRI